MSDEAAGGPLAELNRLKAEYEACLIELSQLRKRFIELAPKALREWSMPLVDTRVKANGEIAAKLGIDKLKQLKVFVAGYNDSVPRLVDELLDIDSVWPTPTRPIVDGHPSTVRRIRAAVSRCEQPLADELVRLGFGFEKRASAQFASAINGKECEAWEPMVEYGSMLDTAVRLRDDVKKAERELSAADGVALWDQA